MDVDFHPLTQRNGSGDQSTMKVHNQWFTIAGQRFSNTISLDHDL
jgi:hypothetical protein